MQIDAGAKSQAFNVYRLERLGFEDKWRIAGSCLAGFALKYREPEPVKRMLHVTGPGCSITLTNPKVPSASRADE